MKALMPQSWRSTASAAAAHGVIIFGKALYFRMLSACHVGVKLFRVQAKSKHILCTQYEKYPLGAYQMHIEASSIRPIIIPIIKRS